MHGLMMCHAVGNMRQGQVHSLLASAAVHHMQTSCHCDVLNIQICKSEPRNNAQVSAWVIEGVIGSCLQIASHAWLCSEASISSEVLY